MNILQKTARQIIKTSFHFSVWLIKKVYNMSAYEEQLQALRKYPIRTLGYDIARCLDENKLGFVPNFESHDLKHVLLDFKMTPVDEIRMQAFMLGNGNYSFPCFAIFIFGAILLPDEWTTFYQDFKRGQKSKPISTWTIEDVAASQTLTLRQQVFDINYNKKPINTMKTFVKIGAFTSITAGVFGMIFCLPFLFSSNIADLVGAGFPFVGGAILAVGGLFTLSNLTRGQTIEYV